MVESGGVAIATVYSILVLIDIVGNSLVCLIIKKNREMRNSVNYLIVNLAVADILYAVFIVPDVFIKLTFTHPEGTTGSILCKLLTGGNIAWVAINSSLVTLAAIAIERYYAVMYPLGDKGNFIKEKLKGIILGSWIFAIILPDTSLWTVTEVVSFFSSLGFPEEAKSFQNQEIDGKALLLMSRNDVLTGMSIKLGPALKIYVHVARLQSQNGTIPS
ncbi:probable G-protein coupled receptor 19 [Montipora foliosa]|uniref:probable G-protein coupled receptor 19 n=1 Tax=Montipora foliosa TaxID=591990 RepID=UPI0035F20BA3